VLALNPVALSDEDSFIGPEVAGLNTSNEFPLSFINISEDNESYKTSLKLAAERSYEYTVSFNDFREEAVRNKFLKIRNTSASNATFRIEAVLPENLKDVLTIKIIDNVDQITMSKPSTEIKQRTISLQPLSERTFNIEFIADTPINYSFDINFHIFD